MKLTINQKQKKLNSNPSRSRFFGVVINPIFEGSKDWIEMENREIDEFITSCEFPNKIDIIEILNIIKVENVNKNLTKILDFEGQFEIGDKTSIPHYQLAIEMESVCTKKKLLEALQKQIKGHINVNIQHNFETMKDYELKDTKFISEKYSGKIFKYQWRQDFLERKPNLRRVLEEPYPWQEFLQNQILYKNPEDRIVDWIIDPVGKTGKSSCARAYVSRIQTDGLLMKIDNLDRMELTLISKIEDYRKKYYKDPKVIFFDFPRATNSKQVVSATCLMEDAKSGHLETSFGGRMKEIDISDIHVIVFSNTAPDLSILSEDRWRLWKLGGTKYENIMWPCSITTYVKDFHEKNKVITWQVKLTGILPKNLKTEYQFRNLDLNENWYYKKSSNNKIFGLEPQSTKPMVTTIPESPNFVRLGLSNYLKSSE